VQGGAWLGLCGIFCLLGATDPSDAEVRKYTVSGYAQGTNYTITYYATDQVLLRGSVDSLLTVIDSSMSLYKPYSLINKINGGGQGVYEVDEHFRNVLRKSSRIHRRSRGSFDITIAPLVQLWGFGAEAIRRLPDSADVSLALKCVGMDKIRLKGHRLEKKADCVQLDMNGIAQGYSVDLLADLLDRKGVRHYVVELGGELRVKGGRPDGTPMRIGIERPTTGSRNGTTLKTVITIAEGAVTTAGNYRKFQQDGAETLSHHIDPKTGYPFQTGIISATVYARNAMTADAYDNVIMAMHADEAIRFVEGQKDLEAFIIYKEENGSLLKDTMSSGFRRLIMNY
jgi:Membrane-associated lipoprotein involved in thiamine biosynthesis